MTTASIPQRQGSGAYGTAPVPSGDVGGDSQGYSQGGGGYGQPYPQQAQGGYAPASVSPARSSAAPIQRAALAPPAGAVSQSSLPPLGEAPARQEAMAQPMPATSSPSPVAARRMAAANDDGAATGATGPGWSTTNAPRVNLRPGENAKILSQRYGVPEKEILKANGGVLTPGQNVIIPIYAARSNAAKAAAASGDLANGGDAPAPLRPQGDKVAVLPGAAAARDKAQADSAGKLTPPSGGEPVPPKGGSYVVKPGDTLSKIARATNTPIDRLKADNSLADGQLRVGQTLKVAGAHGEAVQTASVPHATAAGAKAQPAVAASSEQTPAKATEKPATTQTASLSDVESKSDVSTPAPSSTGISKYRWPATGAVIAAFGANVDGNRNDGIDISVPEGTPIKAAENGVVIYAGNGLKQLGNTVLVRHDDGKVTVYGHAASISVSRGQKVQRGQTLALSGMSGDAKRPQVHFEVRKDATPVNPMTFLE